MYLVAVVEDAPVGAAPAVSLAAIKGGCATDLLGVEVAK